MNEFFTRESADRGVTLDLYLPNGKKTDKSLEIIGVDSDVFRSAQSAENRTLLQNRARLRDGSITEAEFAAAGEEGRIRLLSACVRSWTLEDEFTPLNVAILLREAPQIADAVDKVAGDRASFFEQS